MKRFVRLAFLVRSPDAETHRWTWSVRPSLAEPGSPRNVAVGVGRDETGTWSLAMQVSLVPVLVVGVGAAVVVGVAAYVFLRRRRAGLFASDREI